MGLHAAMEYHSLHPVLLMLDTSQCGKTVLYV